MTHYFCFRRRRISLSWYAPDATGWVPKRPTSTRYKKREARYARKLRRNKKRQLGHHMRNLWLARDYRSLEWTTCGEWVLGPPLGTWEEYPRSKRTRQREARQIKRAKALNQMLGYLPKVMVVRPW